MNGLILWECGNRQIKNKFFYYNKMSDYYYEDFEDEEFEEYYEEEVLTGAYDFIIT